MDLHHVCSMPRRFSHRLHRSVGERPMEQWRIDKKLERAERRLAKVQAQAALWRQINDVDNKLKMLSENRALYHGRLAVPGGDADRHHRDG